MTYTQRKTIAEIQVVVERWKQSELPMVRFAEEEGLSPSTFYNWVQRTKASKHNRKKPESRLLKLPTRPQESSACALEISTPSGHTIRIQSGASSSEIEMIVRTVLACSV